VRDGEDLALEILGKAVVPLTYIGEDSWKFRPNPSVVLEFQRSSGGEVTGYRIGDHEEFRFEPSADLPSAEEMAARVAQAHRLDLLESIGPLRLHSTLTMEKLGMEGEVQTLLAWPGHFRYESTVANQFERVAYNGEQVWYESALKPLAALDGKRAAFTRVDSPFARFGDWKRWYPSFEVVQELHRKGRKVILVRMGNCSAPATTLYVDAETGRMIHTDGMAEVEGMGTIGQRVSYGDFRDVSGVLLPYRSEVEIANPLIGTIATRVTEVEVGVELAEGVFELSD